MQLELRNKVGICHYAAVKIVIKYFFWGVGEGGGARGLMLD
jgi:hypothetical protein